MIAAIREPHTPTSKFAAAKRAQRDLALRRWFPAPSEPATRALPLPPAPRRAGPRPPLAECEHPESLHDEGSNSCSGCGLVLCDAAVSEGSGATLRGQYAPAAASVDARERVVSENTVRRIPTDPRMFVADPTGARVLVETMFPSVAEAPAVEIEKQEAKRGRAPRDARKDDYIRARARHLQETAARIFTGEWAVLSGGFVYVREKTAVRNSPCVYAALCASAAVGLDPAACAAVRRGDAAGFAAAARAAVAAKMAELNAAVIEEIAPLVIRHEAHFAGNERRRRYNLSLYEAVVTAHMKVVHGLDTSTVEACACVQSARPVAGANGKIAQSARAKVAEDIYKSSFLFAVGGRLGVAPASSSKIAVTVFSILDSEKGLAAPRAKESESEAILTD